MYAFSCAFPGRPVIVLAAERTHPAAARFDAAHELGHLVMHHDEDPGSHAAERQAHAFAAELLAPADQIVDDPPRRAGPVDVLRQALRHPIGVLESQRDLVVRQFRVMMATPSLETVRREQFHRFEDPLAAAIATRLGRHPGDLDARLLAAATAALRISIERWVATGARRGTLRPLVDEAFDRLEHGLGASKRAAER